MKRVLISHSWTKPDNHSEIVRLLDRHRYEFIDRSVLPSEPLTAKSEVDLKRQLSQRIAQASIVSVIATEDVHRKPLVQYEIEESVRQGKRLVAVQPLGSATRPVPRFVDAHANAIVGFRGERIVAAIEGDDIRNRSSYLIAEMDDTDRTAHALGRSVAAAAIICVIAREQWLPAARAFLQSKGYSVLSPSLSQERILENMLLWGLVGLLVGTIIGGRWPATLALGVSALAGVCCMGTGVGVNKVNPQMTSHANRW